MADTKGSLLSREKIQQKEKVTEGLCPGADGNFFFLFYSDSFQPADSGAVSAPGTAGSSVTGSVPGR